MWRGSRASASGSDALDPLALADERVARFAGEVALGILENGRWRELTYGELSRRARSLAAHLVATGLAAGDRVAILSESRPEWGVAFFGVLRAGGIAVPLDPKLAEGALAAILADCTPRVVLASRSSTALAERALARAQVSARLIDLDSLDEPASGADAASALGSRRPPPDATAAIIYTSGTTGSPKGVMISFGSLIFETLSLQEVIAVGPGDRLLSILPLHHLLELTGGFLGVLNRGGTICYSSSLFPQDIMRLFRERKIKAMIGVPLFFRTFKAGLEREIRHGAGRAMRLGFSSAWLAARFLPWRRVRRLLFHPLYRRLGGRLEVFISGGAPLEPQVARFFDRLGLPILEGYGLTETSPVVSVNTLRARRIGSVGRPLPGVEVRIDRKQGDGSDAEGEILTRGPHVMKGYYRREDLTRETVDAEGWLHTGDLGKVDRGGFLYLTGRLRILIVLASGKKVHPEEVEAALEGSPRIREACVVGRPAGGRPAGARPAHGSEEVCAVVVPKEAAETADKSVEEEVARMARDLSPYKRPTSVIVRREELPRTPSGKLLRSLITAWVEKREHAG